MDFRVEFYSNELFVHFPFEDTARLALLELGENLQPRRLHGREIDTVVAVLAHGIGRVTLDLLPLALGVLVVEAPRLGRAEVAVIVVEVEPIHLYVRYLVCLVELIGDGFCRALLQPPVVVGLRGVGGTLGLPLVVGAASPGIDGGRLWGIVLDRTAVAEGLGLRGNRGQRGGDGCHRGVGNPHLHLLASPVVPGGVRDGAELHVLHLAVLLELLGRAFEHHHAVEQVLLEMGADGRTVQDILVEDLVVGLVCTFEAEHDRTTLEGHLAAIVLGIVVSHDTAHVHREVELDGVALLPTARDLDIVAVLWIERLAVHADAVGLGLVLILIEVVVRGRRLQP